MNVLVTGGAGFIGSHTVERLLREGAARVSILDSFNDYYDPAIKRVNVRGFADQVAIHEGELNDRAFVDRVFDEGKFDAVIVNGWTHSPWMDRWRCSKRSRRRGGRVFRSSATKGWAR